MIEKRTTLVKICGITREEDARVCARLGVDWIGVNFWPPSKRYVSDERARAVVQAARAEPRRGGAAPIEVVGVFVNQPLDEIRRIVREVGLDRVQLHGDETVADCQALVSDGIEVIKAMGINSPEDAERLASYPGAVVLVDTPSVGYGGSGQSFDWDLVRGNRALARKKVILAGGLRPSNAADAVLGLRPYAIDVASGVESEPGIKERRKISNLLMVVAHADRAASPVSDVGNLDFE